jgi:hypothetical protein
MANEAGESKVVRLRFECGSHTSMAEFVSDLAGTIARELGCDEVNVQLRRDEELFVGQFPRRTDRVGSSEGALFELHSGAAYFQGNPWPLPLVVNDLHEPAYQGSSRSSLQCAKFDRVVSFHSWKGAGSKGSSSVSSHARTTAGSRRSCRRSTSSPTL